MAHRNRWCTMIYLLKMVSFQFATLNYQRVQPPTSHQPASAMSTMVAAMAPKTPTIPGASKWEMSTGRNWEKWWKIWGKWKKSGGSKRHHFWLISSENIYENIWYSCVLWILRVESKGCEDWLVSGSYIVLNMSKVCCSEWWILMIQETETSADPQLTNRLLGCMHIETRSGFCHVLVLEFWCLVELNVPQAFGCCFFMVFPNVFDI